jgi:hypothetical protein
VTRSLFIFAFLAALALGGYLFLTPGGLDFGKIQMAFNQDKQTVYNRSRSFLEDLKFKDFQKAASYHTPDEQAKADIPKLIEEKFLIKPELLDVRDFEVTEVEVDSTGERARSKTVTHYKVLNTNEVRDAEIIFYWKKTGGTWYMQLRSSLQH